MVVGVCAIVIFLGSSITCAMDMAGRGYENPYAIVLQEHIQTLPPDPEVSSAPRKHDALTDIDATVTAQLAPSVRARFTKAGTLLGTFGQAHTRYVASADERHDLDLIKGNHQTPTVCLARIIPTVTATGAVAKCVDLMSPYTDCHRLQARTQAMNICIQKTASLTAKLKAVATYEGAFLSFCSETGSIGDPFYKHIIAKNIAVPYAHKNQILARAQQMLNRSELVMALQELSPLIGVAIEAHSLMPTVKAVLAHSYDVAGKELDEVMYIDRYAADGMVYTLIKMATTSSKLEPLIQLAGYGLWAKQEINWATDVLGKLRKNAYRIAAMQTKLRYLSHFMHQVAQLGQELRASSNAELHAIGSQLSFESDSQLAHLYHELQEPRFKDDAGVMPEWGTIKSIYQKTYDVFYKKKIRSCACIRRWGS